jgi:RsiW-degrading membrane proteinase PrsW (M82 family)
MAMNELHVTLGDRSYSFDGGATVRIGRSPDNDIVVGDPTVSRQHAQLSHGPRGWEFVNVGRALSYLNGEPVTRAVLSGPARIQLSSLDGPALAITPVTAGPPPAEPPAARPAPAEPLADEPLPAEPSASAGAGPAAAGGPDLGWLGLAEPAPDAAAPDAAAPDAAAPDAAAPDQAARDQAARDEAAADEAAADRAAAASRPDATSVMASPLASEPGFPGGPEYAGYPAQGIPPRPRVPAGESVDEIATALHILIPIRSWLHDPGWRQFLRLLVIPYGLLPLIFIALFAGSDSLATPGWAYSLYIAPLWAIVFWLLIRPGPVGRREWLIGAGAIAFSLVWIRLVTVNLNQVMGRPGKPLSFPGAIGVGLNEEITKALPILLAALLLLKLRSVKLDVRMWMFLGAIVGLAFGVTEQAGYTLQDIQAITSAQANSEIIVEVLAFAERVFVDGFQHALWAGVSAFFIGMAVNYPRRRIALIALGIAIPAGLHGLYDWSAGAFASLWVPIIIQALSVFLFLGYTMSAAAIERRVRQTPMFRGESMLFDRITDSGSYHRGSAPPPGPRGPVPPAS